MYGYSREAIRVKVKKREMNCPPEWRKFSVDPQITSVEVLHSLLAKAFDIRSEFSVSYSTFDPVGRETFLAVLSDCDLDAAFLRTHNYSVQTGSEPCLNLRVDVKSFSETNNLDSNSSEIYNKLENSSLQQSIGVGHKYVQNMQNKLPGLIMNHVEKTFSMVQRALNFAEEQIPIYPPRAPLSDTEFIGFLNSVGQIIRPQELRKVIFLGGIDPSLRKVVWKHILNVYPIGMTGRERMDYIKKKGTEYCKLRDVWKSAVQQNSGDSELAYVTSMVRKDVLRTDRLHEFYAGSDDNQNITSLFNILTTYALNHPKVSYCQGMSDLASPLLVTMKNEDHAYICFCAIMERLQANFMLDGIAMTQKFSHLSEALQYYDSEFYEYLKLQQADDLLFCYRWLLLELKREFPFEDSLRMLEVLWSSLQIDPPDKELKLFDKEFLPQVDSASNCKKQTPQNSLISKAGVQRKQRENHYANICALRRQTSSFSLYNCNSSNQASLDYFSEEINDTSKLDRFKRLNHSLDENISRASLKRTNLMKAHQSLDETKMLFLMRNITSPCEKFTESFNHFNKDFNNQEISISDKNIENKKIIFHSTNPFINDAQGGSTEILVCDDRVEQKNFENIQSNFGTVHINRTEDFSNSDKNLLNDSFKRNCPSKSESIISAQIMNKHKGHFKELKEKIAASKKGILASIDKIETHLDIKASPADNQNNIDEEFCKQKFFNNNNTKTNQKVVKNLNEFLNFTNKNRISDKLAENTTKIIEAKTFGEQNGENYQCIMVTNQCDDIFSNSRPIVKLTTQKSSDDSCVLEESLNDYNTLGTKIENIKNDNLKLIDKEKEIIEDCPNGKGKTLEHSMEITKDQSLQSKIENLNCQVFTDEILNLDSKRNSKNEVNISYENLDKVDYLDFIDVNEEEIMPCSNLDTILVLKNRVKPPEISKEENQNKRISTCSSNNADIFIWENPLHQISRNSSCSLNEIGVNDNRKKSCDSTVNSIQNDLRETLVDNSKSQTTPNEQEYYLEYEKIHLERSDENGLIKNSQVPSQSQIQSKQLNCNIVVDSKANIDENTHNIGTSPLNPFLTNYDENDISTIEILKYQENALGELANESKNSVTPETKLSNLSNEHFTMADSHATTTKTIFSQSEVLNEEENPTKFSVNVNIKAATFLPPPNEFGGGNPFLIFLCLTLLLQHRNIIMRSNLDYNEMAMHFDKMVRKHDVNRVLNQARRMYFEYIKTHNALATAAAVTDNSKLSGINIEKKS